MAICHFLMSDNLLNAHHFNFKARFKTNRNDFNNIASSFMTYFTKDSLQIQTGNRMQSYYKIVETQVLFKPLP